MVEENMKIAVVRYEGRMDHHRHRGASGEMFRFGMDEVDVYDVVDAEYFEKKPNFEVEYTEYGKLKKQFGDDVDDARETVEEMGYNAMRSLVSQLGIETESQSKEHLEEALVEVADDLQRQMENQ